MKKFVLRKNNVVAGVCILMLSVFVTACTKNDDSPVNLPGAGLMAFNMAPDQDGVGVTLSGNVLPGGPLPYTSYTGTYLNIYPGNRLVESYGSPSNMSLDTATYNFADGKYYSLFVMGANNQYMNVIAEDNFDSLNANPGNAYIRYVNGIVDSIPSVVTIKGPNGNSIFNASSSYTQFSDFKPVAPGELAVSVMNSSGVNASRNITVQQQKAYTVLLLGIPNATDTTQKVQIRFIENGTITDN